MLDIEQAKETSENMVNWLNDFINGHCDPFIYPNYDANFFDAYCSHYVMCVKVYDANCSPDAVIGISDIQFRILVTILVALVFYPPYTLFGTVAVPEFLCMYIFDWDIDTCTFNVFDEWWTSPQEAAEYTPAEEQVS